MFKLHGKSVCGGNILFSSLYSKYRAWAPSKTHMDYCVFPQIFEEGVRYLGVLSDLAPGRCPDRGKLPDYIVHAHGTHVGNEEL